MVELSPRCSKCVTKMFDLFNNGDPIKVLEVLKAAWAHEDLRFNFVDMEVEIFQ